LTISKKAVKKWAYTPVLVLGVVGIVWSVVAAVSSTGFNSGMVAPAAAGIALILWSAYHLKYDKPVINQRWLRVIFSVFIWLGIALILVLETLMLMAAYAEPKEEADVVIVLGCGIFPDGRLTLSLKNRLDVAYDYLIDHPDVHCIVSGGQGGNEPIPEGQAMQDYLISRGIGAERLFCEAKSTSTEENLTYSLDIIRSKGFGHYAAIVTSDYHIFRASLLAERLGLEAFGIPSPTPWRVWLSCQARECMAIVKTVVFPDWKME